MAEPQANHGLQGEKEPSQPADVDATAGEWIEGRDLELIVRHVARRYGLPKEDLDDLLQEARLALLSHGLGCRLNRAFVFSTAVHKAVDMVRQRLREDRETAGEMSPGADEELLHLLRSRVPFLPRRLQTFYALRYEEGLTPSEISQKLGRSRGAIRWLESRTRMFLTYPSHSPPN